MKMIELWVFAQGTIAAAVGEEVVELGARRKLGRTQEPRDCQRSARVREPCTHRMRLSVQVAAQEAGEECISRTEHVIDLDIQARRDETLLERAWDFLREYHAAARAAFADDDSRGERAEVPDRRERVFDARGDVHLLLGSDDEVAIGQYRGKRLRDPPGA